MHALKATLCIALKETFCTWNSICLIAYMAAHKIAPLCIRMQWEQILAKLVLARHYSDSHSPFLV